MRGVRAEFGKINWPSQAEVFSLTVLVLVMIIILTLYTRVLDVIFTRLLQYFTRG